MPPRAVDRALDRSARAERPDRGHCGCRLRGCDRRTAMGKPFCAVHIGELPYAARVIADVEAGAADPIPKKAAPVIPTGARWFGFEF